MSLFFEFFRQPLLQQARQTLCLLICLALFSSLPQAAQAEVADKAAGWTPAADPLPLPPANEASIELMAGQMLIVGFRGVRPEANPIIKDIEKYQLGGIILFDRDYNFLTPTRNITSKEQLTRLVTALHNASPYPLFVSVDQEGGKVRRLKSEKGFFPLPSAQDLGTEDPANTREIAEQMAAELKEVGINLDFAPVVDVNISPESPAIGALKRAFSAEPATVTAHARAFLDGMHAQGVLGSLKHFPGHGSAAVDTHKGVSDISNTWQRDKELYPYLALIPEDNADMVMVGHLMNSEIDPEYPASLSHATITGLLRGELGFDGVVISDDLQMGAISSRYSLEEVVLLAINAGMDILLYGNNISYDEELPGKVHACIVKLVNEGKISRERLEESYTRICRLKQKLE